MNKMSRMPELPNGSNPDSRPATLIITIPSI